MALIPTHPIKLSFLNLFLKIILFIYLRLAVLSLHCCVEFSLVVASRGYSLVAVNVLLIAVASFVVEHMHRACAGFSSSGMWAQ